MQYFFQCNRLHILTYRLGLRKIKLFFRIIILQLVADTIFCADNKFSAVALARLVDDPGGAAYVVRKLQHCLGTLRMG